MSNTRGEKDLVINIVYENESKENLLDKQAIVSVQDLIQTSIRANNLKNRLAQIPRHSFPWRKGGFVICIILIGLPLIIGLGGILAGTISDINPGLIAAGSFFVAFSVASASFFYAFYRRYIKTYEDEQYTHILEDHEQHYLENEAKELKLEIKQQSTLREVYNQLSTMQSKVINQKNTYKAVTTIFDELAQTSSLSNQKCLFFRGHIPRKLILEYFLDEPQFALELSQSRKSINKWR